MVRSQIGCYTYHFGPVSLTTFFPVIRIFSNANRLHTFVRLFSTVVQLLRVHVEKHMFRRPGTRISTSNFHSDISKALKIPSFRTSINNKQSCHPAMLHRKMIERFSELVQRLTHMNLALHPIDLKFYILILDTPITNLEPGCNRLPPPHHPCERNSPPPHSIIS